MKKLLKRFMIISLIICFLFQAVSCGKDDTNFVFYYKTQNKNELMEVRAVLDRTAESGVLISTIFQHMRDSVDGSGYISIVPRSLELKTFALEDHNLVLNFSAAYPEPDSISELLLRAALVMTYCQLDEVSSVEIRTEGQAILHKDGRAVGPQKASNFADVIRTGLNIYSTAQVTVYFANETGEKLVKSSAQIVYDSSYPLAQFIITKLISGPIDETQGRAVIPKETKLLSVNVSNGVCYVNLNDEILKESTEVSPEVTIYSIVNSLTELSGISSVSISVNGSSQILFRDSIDLSSPLTRNLDYVEEEKAEVPEETAE